MLNQPYSKHDRLLLSRACLACLLQLCMLDAAHGQYGLPAVALYYGDKPTPLLRLYDTVIVQPNDAVDPKQFNTTYRQAIAYVSLGEVYSLDMYQKAIKPAWILGENRAWHTRIIDQTQQDWRSFFMQQVIDPLWQKGYRGFYLDTLDSYKQVIHDAALQHKQQQAMIATIQAIKQRHPSAHILLNRGFELLPALHHVIHGITVESVFYGWDNQKQRYFQVPEQARRYVLAAIRTAQKLAVPVTIIDYMDHPDPPAIASLVGKIRALGCEPWITNAKLDAIYLQPSQALARKILILYNGKLADQDEKMGSPAVKFYTMPLNYLGYTVELRNINEPLPQHLSPQHYAGIIMSINGILLTRQHALQQWYRQQMQQHIPILILNDFGFMLSSQSLQPFGLSLPMLTHKHLAKKVVYQSPMIGYEIAPGRNINNEVAVQIQAPRGIPLLRVRDNIGLLYDIAGIMPWGGYYMGPGFLPSVGEGQYHWAINPFAFFQQALQLPKIPIPDTTTENGLRLMFAHVDGDGFSNQGEWFGAPYTGEIMLEKIIQRYPLPITVSIIQGETASNGLHPDASPALEAIARRIFALPQVEIASHTFSHPFNWKDAASFQGKGKNPYILPIPNYRFALAAEINGSVDYINKNLAPANKSCRMFLWSGEGDVPEKALKMVKKLHLGNINPGTMVTRYNPSLTRISALGVAAGDYLQVFAPNGNDHEAQGFASNERFFYANINIINALKLTESPLRLKPIDLYMHFFTLAQPGGLKALQTVYDWILQQPILPIFTSTYVDIVNDFKDMLLIPTQDGYIIAGNDALRELRIPKSLGYPDLETSQHIVGMSEHQHVRYIHLAPGGDAFIRLTHHKPKRPYLVTANARLLQAEISNRQQLRYTFRGALPLQWVMANTSHCQVFANQKRIYPLKTRQNQQYYRLAQETTAEVTLQCD